MIAKIDMTIVIKMELLNKNLKRQKINLKNFKKNNWIKLIFKKTLPDCIYCAVKSLEKKLFELNDSSNGIFKDFTSIFKTGILFDKILKQSPIILKNISNLSTAVLERFNGLFNYNPKLTLNEDFCDTFTGEMKTKEISNFSDQFRVISISSLTGIRNLSDAAKSRISTIYTSEYDHHEKEIESNTFVQFIPQEFFKFISQ